MNNPYYEKNGVLLWWGDCLDVLDHLLPNSVDSIITDPPYSLSSIKKRFSKTSLDDDNKTSKNARDSSTPHARLSKGFMGKTWDGDIAFNPEVWEKCLRVAKPGCILMAMGGSRTSHRLACAIEDVGWEIRDEIKYFYNPSQQFISFLNSFNDEQLSAYLELHYPSSELAWVYGQGIGLGHDVGKGIDKAKGKEREVVGSDTNYGITKLIDGKTTYGDFEGKWDITVPATELAKLFEGYNSRLKPAHENIIVAMKPIEGTYANNAEVYGIAGFNVDGSRIGTEERINLAVQMGRKGVYGKLERNSSYTQTKGRYPANIIHDDSDGVNKEFGFASRYFQSCPLDVEPARFLYTSKASKKERGKGNSHPTQKPLSLMRYLCKLTKTPTGGIVLDPFAGSGTTLLAAREEGREAIGIELEKEYCEIIVKRLQGREDVSPNKDEEKEEETEINSFIDSVLYD